MKGIESKNEQGIDNMCCYNNTYNCWKCYNTKLYKTEYTRYKYSLGKIRGRTNSSRN